MTAKYNVSIIVPVYNREEIIEKCIGFINLQSYDKVKWKIIVLYFILNNKDRAAEITKIIFQYLEKIKLKNKNLLK